MTMALEGGEWSAARPGRTLPPGKTRYQLHRRLGALQGRSGRAENLAPPGFDPRTVQPVVIGIQAELPGPPVAVVQYTFTHKQYTEQHNETEYPERNVYNSKNT